MGHELGHVAIHSFGLVKSEAYCWWIWDYFKSAIIMIIFGFLVGILTLIPRELDSAGVLCKNIQPSNDIIWWETGIWDSVSDIYRIHFSSDSIDNGIFPIQLSRNTTYSSLFIHMSFTRRFLIYTTCVDDKVRYINKVEEVPRFLGTIDNISEALFLANLYGFNFIPGYEYGSYYLENEAYVINLYKVHQDFDLPVVIIHENGTYSYDVEKAKIKVDFNGNVYEIIENKEIQYKKLGIDDMYRID